MVATATTVFFWCNSSVIAALGMTAVDLCRMVKWHMKVVALPIDLSPHSLRVTVATDLLGQDIPLDQVQYLLGHADPRTTRLYDRRQQKVSRTSLSGLTSDLLSTVEPLGNFLELVQRGTELLSNLRHQGAAGVTKQPAAVSRRASIVRQLAE